MGSLQGFWSYVHEDDRAEQGRIQALASDLKDQFQMLTGETIELFLDKEALEWGDEWRDKIESSLGSVAFFIPVMTPRYFQSAQCRGELRFFAQRAENLGIQELVLPLYYVDVAALESESDNDDLLRLVGTFQWEDWRQLRFEDRSGMSYRTAVARLAQRLVAANKRAEEANVVDAAQRLEHVGNEDSGEEPGFIDELAMAEEAMPKWTETLNAIAEEILAIGEMMQDATTDVRRGDEQAKGFSHRLAIAQRLAKRLERPAGNISAFGNQYVSQLADVDVGVRTIISRAPAEIEADPGARRNLCEFFDSVKYLAEKAREGRESTNEMIVAIGPIENMSRDLRPVLRRLRKGLTVMVEASDVTDSWVRLIDESGVDCSDLDVSGADGNPE